MCSVALRERSSKPASPFRLLLVCAELISHLQTQLGEPDEVTAHLSGVQALVNLRGGISNVNIEGCFLHMTCT